MRPVMMTHRRARAGVSMIEIAVTLGVVAILTAVGAMLIRDAIPAWRTRRAAEDFASVINTARNRAIAEGFEYRVRLVATDQNLDDESDNVGIYTIERGNRSVGSDTWDILPLDDNGGDTEEGTTNLAPAADEGQRWVSIAPWGSTSTDGDDILFSPRGWVTNADSDFDANGKIAVVFVNKRARLDGGSDERSVEISRSGMVRIVDNGSNYATPAVGVSGTSRTTASTGSGFVGP